eukprot:2838271-Karenia_brevis.AAC.1
MPYPMTDVRLPASATARGVVRPASRDPVPAPPRQVQRSRARGWPSDVFSFSAVIIDSEGSASCDHLQCGDCVEG